MSKEEFIKKTKDFIIESRNYGFDPQRAAEEVVNASIEQAEEYSEKMSLEDCINKIKKSAEKKGLDAEVTIKYK